MARHETHLRQCLVTRERRHANEMIRFVRDPDGRVVPDVRRVLPGRGVWVTASRARVAEAVRRRLFARGFKADVRVEEDLAELTDELLERDALAALSMARKAGLVTAGFEKVRAALKEGRCVAVVEAADGAGDGRGKLMRLAMNVAGDHNAVPVVDVFDSASLSAALGLERAVHVGLHAGSLSEKFLARAGRLARYRDQEDAGLRSASGAAAGLRSGDVLSSSGLKAV